MHCCLLFLFSFMVAMISDLSAVLPAKDTPVYELNEQAILELAEETDLRIEGEKIFIHPEKICVTDHGLFLDALGKYFLIPHLQSCSTGCYVSYSKENSAVYPLITCKNCGKVFNPSFFNQGKCPRCGVQN